MAQNDCDLPAHALILAGAKKRYDRASLCFLHKGLTNARLARTGGVQMGLYVMTM
jgi:hypothetical protein